MIDLKRNLWISNLFFIFIAISIVLAIKNILNPLLLDNQKLLGQNQQLLSLPKIQNKIDLFNKIDELQFSYIEVNQHQIATPIIFQSNPEHLFDKLLKTPVTVIKSDTTDQTISYRALNKELLNFYHKLVWIIIIGLIFTMVFYSSICFKLLKKIENEIVDEILENKKTKQLFKKVSIELNEQKRLYQESLQKKEELVAQLLSQVNLDKTTGLNNRQAFRKELTEFLSNVDNQNQAILCIIRTFDLNAINTSRGFQHGDEYIENIAKIIKTVSKKFENVSLFRINGSEFALIIYGMTVIEAQKFSIALKIKFDEYQSLTDLESVAYTGVTSIYSNQLPEQVLARTDMALAKAQSYGSNAWYIEDNKNQDNEQFHLGGQHWRTIITEIIDNRSFSFLQQPVQFNDASTRAYKEIYTRFIGKNDNTIPANIVFSMAKRTDMILKLERIIIEAICQQFRQKEDFSSVWGINLSSTSIQNSSFMIWLERLLLKDPNVAASLVFELDENLLDSNLASSSRVFTMIRRSGSRSAICSFGKGISSFKLFKELKPDYIKIDSSLISNIRNDSANQQYLRMMIDAAHRMECKVIAESIEYEEQKQLLETMYVDGIQGYLIARPSAL